MLGVVWFAGAALFSTRAIAHPTSTPLWGPTGLGTIPTTDTVAPGQIEAAVGYEDIDPGFGGEVRFFPVLSATYGFKKGEIGAGYLRERNEFFGESQSYDNFNLNGKYRILQSRRERGGVPDAALAAGFHYTDFDDDLGHLSSFYLTGSKVVFQRNKHLLRGHVGALHQRVSSFVDDNYTRPFFGGEYRYNNRITLAADYIPEKDPALRTWSFVARYESQNNWSAQVGYGEFGSPLKRDDKRLMASVAYRFGGNGSSRAAESDDAKPLSGTFTMPR